MEAERSLLLTAELAKLAGVLSLVAEAAGEAGLSERRREHLNLAVEEAFVNVCRHAYGGNAGPVEVRVHRQGGQVSVLLVDQGSAFDPLAAAAADPNAALAERRAGGMGLTLLRSVTDGLVYRREGDRNVLEIVVGETTA